MGETRSPLLLQSTLLTLQELQEVVREMWKWEAIMDWAGRPPG